MLFYVCDERTHTLNVLCGKIRTTNSYCQTHFFGVGQTRKAKREKRMDRQTQTQTDKLTVRRKDGKGRDLSEGTLVKGRL